MEKEYYFLIHCNDDGETTIERVDYDVLIARFNDPDHYGNDVKFVLDLTETDPQYWKGDFLIIKGKIAIPKFKTVTFE